MSADSSVELGGCDASIMKNVWEIREREFETKMHQEAERIKSSAMPSINKDWENRLAVRSGKKVERKPNPDELDNENVQKSKEPFAWKKAKPPQATPAVSRSTAPSVPAKKPQVTPAAPRATAPPKTSREAHAPPAAPRSTAPAKTGREAQPQTNGPRGVGSAPLGRPGVQSRGVSAPTPSYQRDQKGQGKNSLMWLNQNQPSAEDWGKSWIYDKSLPLPEETPEAISNWGQCWMLATQQPYSAPGEPWLNGPNMRNPQNLHLWEKTDFRFVESEELDLDPQTEKWQMSWRKSVKKNEGDVSPVVEQNGPTSGFFPLLEVTLKSHQQKYRDLYMELSNEFKALSEWSKSWQVNKNNSKPSDEIEKILMASAQRTEASSEAKKVGNTNPKEHHGTSENADPSFYEQLRQNVIYRPNREFPQSKLLLLKHLEKVLSTSEWSEAWKCSTFNTNPLTEEVTRENCADESMEIHPRRERMSVQLAQSKMSRSFDQQIFSERYPEKEWKASWGAASLLNHQPSHGVTSEKSKTSSNQHTTTNGHGSKWGMSFRLANPMPHMEQPWVESNPNPCHYQAMWSSEKKKIQNNINFNSNPQTLKLWQKSHLLPQMGKAQTKDNAKCEQTVRANQPHPQKGSDAIKMEDRYSFLEEWVESWWFSSGSLKKQSSHSCWAESWKFVVPPNQTMNKVK